VFPCPSIAHNLFSLLPLAHGTKFRHHFTITNKRKGEKKNRRKGDQPQKTTNTRCQRKKRGKKEKNN
jgi:hypothetical protein